MRFLVRAVIAHPERTCSRNELIALVAPEGLVEAMTSIGAGVDFESPEEGDDVKTGGRKIAEASLDALSRLGFISFEGAQVTATATVTDLWDKPVEVTGRRFSSALREALFQLADP